MATPAEISPPQDEPPETGPLRRCLVLRASFARETMLRFVVGPEQNLVFDVGATLPGRGLWLSASGDVIEIAMKRGVFPRAAKQKLLVPPDLPAQILTVLSKRVLEFLGLARRSGAAVSGFEKAREWLTSGKAGLVLQAKDGSAEERARFLGGRDVAVVTVLDAATLGKIFGRDQAVHVVIAPGRLAERIAQESFRLAGVAGGALSGQ